MYMDMTRGDERESRREMKEQIGFFSYEISCFQKKKKNMRRDGWDEWMAAVKLLQL